jgi:hypothetical protein
MTADQRRLRSLLADDYRVACPRGHVSLEPASTTPTAYCRSCGRAYDYAELRVRG